MPIFLKLTLFTFFFSTLLLSSELKPLIKLKTSGFVNDFVIDGTTLYAATTSGVIDVFDLYSKKEIEKILLPPVKSGRGEMITPSILSIDYLNKKLLIVSSGAQGRKNIWIYENKQLQKVAHKSREALVRKARFLDDDHYLFVTFDSDVIKYQRTEGYENYHRQMTQSRLSDMVLSEDKRVMVMADESGEVRLIDVNSSEEIALVGAQNLDNIYKIAYQNGTILTGGQDRRVGVYPKDEKPYYLKSDFLVFCVGLCDDGGLGAYSSGFDHDIQLFDVKTRAKLYRLVGHRSVINKIYFLTETIIVSAGDETQILIWQLPSAHR